MLIVNKIRVIFMTPTLFKSATKSVLSATFIHHMPNTFGKNNTDDTF